MKTTIYLILAILGNALGSALMYQSHLGLSAWGAAAANMSNYIPAFSPGESFLLISLFFFGIAIIIHKHFVISKVISSLIFLVSFSTLLDVFLTIIPDMEHWTVIVRLGFNVLGLFVLLFSIALHIHVNIAIHPMDVFLKVMQQEVFKNVVIGTYVAYLCAFIVAIIFGALYGDIMHFGIGTVMIIVLGGSIMGLYDRYIIRYL